jgi:nucleoside-diphosphate-sugar epimerase
LGIAGSPPALILLGWLPARAYNVAHDAPVTQVEAVKAFAAAGGKQAKIVRVPREIIERNGGKPIGEPLYFGEYLDLPPITEKIERVKRELNVKLTDFAGGLKETYRWYAEQGPKRRLDFSFEDRLMREAEGETGWQRQ